MATYTKIPQELIEMIREQRVIPFLGAGFSSAFNFPDWDSLLSKLAGEIEGCLPYATLSRECGGDPLQIAEYLYLKCDKSIGPLRHAISSALQTSLDALSSGSHVDLVNLGAPYVYTTNYDEMIERAYRRLDRSFSVVALPKHIATASGKKSQIIKYHGDLRHEATLVLTESSYYSRLDFESPMDLKFRSDLLGRSVLFIGYSFRDINIRVIWFKLMDMMKDIPVSDRPSSFIVRFSHNPALELLYESVGIHTIVLDPKEEASSPEEKSAILDRFMFALSAASGQDDMIPGSETKQFLSKTVINEIERHTPYFNTVPARRIAFRNLTTPDNPEILKYISVISRREIPRGLIKPLQAALDQLKDVVSMTGSDGLIIIDAAITCSGLMEKSSFVLSRIALGLILKSTRDSILANENSINWKNVWSGNLTELTAMRIIKRLESEIDSHEIGEIDFDLAYLAELVCRIKSNQIYRDAGEVIELATKALDKASKLYSSVAELKPDPVKPPEVCSLINQIEAAQPEDEGNDPNDLPF